MMILTQVRPIPRWFSDLCLKIQILMVVMLVFPKLHIISKFVLWALFFTMEDLLEA